MRKFRLNKETLKACAIFSMLKTHADKRHVSFHMPGNKWAKWDITELSFSDNLASPSGCIAAAERDLSRILGANRSFILTNGSTSGVFSMLDAAKRAGVKTVAASQASHKSLFNACALLGLTPFLFTQKTQNGIPVPLSGCDLSTDGEFMRAFENADALFLTSPDYYGNIPPLQAVRSLCERHGKLLLIDGAHGGHLHFDKTKYAGAYADMWVDGVHKSLPALTQGAIVSAREETLSERLWESVGTFRSTSPSYPVMASVEYAVKYPHNQALEADVRAFVAAHKDRLYQNDDWTKVCALFEGCAFKVQDELEKQGIYPEFADGNAVLFYLSPATTKREFALLKRTLLRLFKAYPTPPKRESENQQKHTPAPPHLTENTQIEWVEFSQSTGEICASACGLFPPCTPLIGVGETIETEKLQLLQKAKNTFGLKDGKIAVLKNGKKE